MSALGAPSTPFMHRKGYRLNDVQRSMFDVVQLMTSTKDNEPNRAGAERRCQFTATLRKLSCDDNPFNYLILVNLG